MVDLDARSPLRLGQRGVEEAISPPGVHLEALTPDLRVCRHPTYDEGAVLLNELTDLPLRQLVQLDMPLAFQLPRDLLAGEQLRSSATGRWRPLAVELGVLAPRAMLAGSLLAIAAFATTMLLQLMRIQRKSRDAVTLPLAAAPSCATAPKLPPWLPDDVVTLVLIDRRGSPYRDASSGYRSSSLPRIATALLLLIWRASVRLMDFVLLWLFVAGVAGLCAYALTRL